MSYTFRRKTIKSGFTFEQPLSVPAESWLLLDNDPHRIRRDTVGNHDQGAVTCLGTRQYVELSAREFVACGHCHGAVVMGAGKELVLGRIIGDPHNRVVGGGLAIVSEASTLRETVELRAAHGVRASNETHSRVTTRTDVGCADWPAR